MKQFFTLFIAILAVTFFAGCHNKGSSAPAPTNVSVVAGENRATVTWDMLPGIQYWVFKAATPDITPENCLGTPECQIFTNVASPYLVASLANGTLYSFTVNGRTDSGPGGPGSPSIQAIPRPAGGLWSVSTPVTGLNDLRGVTHSSIFVAVGTSGTLLTSADGLAWTTQTAPSPLTNFNAITYGGTYVAVGTGGVLLTSADAVNWTQATNASTNTLYAVTTNGAGEYVATGASGTIINNSVGGWNLATSIPVGTPTLNGVAYGNGKYVAVGAGGSVLTSDTYGNNWTSVNATVTLPTSDLKSIAYGPGVGATGPATNATGTFVAAGASGSVVSSTDGGLTWGAPASFAPGIQINAVTYGSQFIAVADNGSIYYSTNGVNWTLATSSPANGSPVYAVVHGFYDYSAVGAAGLNMHSQ